MVAMKIGQRVSTCSCFYSTDKFPPMGRDTDHKHYKLTQILENKATLWYAQHIIQNSIQTLCCFSHSVKLNQYIPYRCRIFHVFGWASTTKKSVPTNNYLPHTKHKTCKITKQLYWVLASSSHCVKFFTSLQKHKHVTLSLIFSCSFLFRWHIYHENYHLQHLDTAIFRKQLNSAIRLSVQCTI